MGNMCLLDWLAVYSILSYDFGKSLVKRAKSRLEGSNNGENGFT